MAEGIATGTYTEDHDGVRVVIERAPGRFRMIVPAARPWWLGLVVEYLVTWAGFVVVAVWVSRWSVGVALTWGAVYCAIADGFMLLRRTRPTVFARRGDYLDVTVPGVFGARTHRHVWARYTGVSIAMSRVRAGTAALHLEIGRRRDRVALLPGHKDHVLLGISVELQSGMTAAMAG